MAKNNIQSIIEEYFQDYIKELEEIKMEALKANSENNLDLM